MSRVRPVFNFYPLHSPRASVVLSANEVYDEFPSAFYGSQPNFLRNRTPLTIVQNNLYNYIPIPNFYNNDCGNGEETTFHINRTRLQIHV